MPTTIHGTNGITFNDGSLQKTSAQTGFRNRIINGDMRIDQRNAGASYAITSALYGSCDRWASLAAANGVWTQQRVATGSTDFPFATRVQRVAGSTSTAAGYIGQVIETTNGQDLAGQTITLSFYATAGANFSATSSIIYPTIDIGTGSDQGWGTLNQGNWTAYTAIFGGTQAITTTRTRYSITATVPAGTNEIAIRFAAVGTGTAGANDWFQITGVQLEAGSTATDFERRPIGTELALCQRYYDKSYSIDVAPGTSTFNGIVVGSNEMYAGAWYPMGDSVKFTTEMRRVPDFAYYDGAGTISRMSTFWNNATTSGYNPSIVLYTGTKAVGIRQTAAISVGVPFMLHYTANAEL